MQNSSACQNLNNPKRALIIFGTLVLCLLVLMRYQILNEFSMLSGDRYDVVISTTILEHWFRFFKGEIDWTDVQYFFPYDKTIANTDAYFINSITYVPFRAMGLDVFLSAELSGLLIKSVGFFGTYLLCRKMFSMHFYWALLAAILFTLSNGMTTHSSRIQLATVALFPGMSLLVWSMACELLAGNFSRFRSLGIITAILYGAWCLTCFYMAWFFLLYLSVFTCVIIFSAENLQVLKHRLIAGWKSVSIVFASAVTALIPFLYVYLEKSRETGVRGYEEALFYTVPLDGILQVGNENFLWGKVYNLLLTFFMPSQTPSGEYYNTGFFVGLFFLFLLGCIAIVRNYKERNRNVINLILWSIVITTLFTWFLSLNFFGKSAWYFVFHFFPGAKALRVVSAYQIFLALPVIIISIQYLSNCRFRPIFMVAISSLLIAGELNNPPLKLNRAAELDRISSVSSPPDNCRTFYVSGWKDQDSLGETGSLYAHNVTAMLLAQFVGIPTVNGMASFIPPGVNFSNPNNGDYDRRIFLHAKKHQISNLCKLDLNSKEWSVIEDTSIKEAYTFIPFFKESNWSGRVSITRGLSNFEGWGTWSDAKKVYFEFNSPLPDKFTLYLSARAFGPNIGEDFEVRTGDSVVKFQFASGDIEDKFIPINNSKKADSLEIVVPSPISPKSFLKTQSTDKRNLGIGFVEMKIIPSQ